MDNPTGQTQQLKGKVNVYSSVSYIDGQFLTVMFEQWSHMLIDKIVEYYTHDI